MEYYDLYQRYLRLYESTVSDYIESLDCSIEEFYEQLSAIKDDPTITNKKLLHFVNYLLASTDYPNFYKIMYRAAKKLESRSDSKASHVIGATIGSDTKNTSDADADAKSIDHPSNGSKSEGKEYK